MNRNTLFILLPLLLLWVIQVIADTGTVTVISGRPQFTGMTTNRGSLRLRQNGQLAIYGTGGVSTTLADQAVIIDGSGITATPTTISIGTVTTVPSTTPASVVNSGTSTAAVLDFWLPMGTKGYDGYDGPTGAAATVTVGTTTTGAAGSSAAVTNSGSSSNAILNFLLPRGDTGVPGPVGPANTLTVGTVTTLPYNQQSMATITGTAPNQTLNLALTQGNPGSWDTLSRVNLTDLLAQLSNVVIYIQPATDSPTAGGLVINDYAGHAAVILQNGGIEMHSAAGAVTARIDRDGTITSYKAMVIR